MTKTHDAHVTDQFGPRANAYVASAVHATGADLDRIEAFARAHGGGRALDLGAGGGHVAYRLAPYVGEVVAYDLSEEMLAAVATTAAARGLGNVTTRQGRAETLPFPDASFDLVASRFSAHHWGDLDAALREVRRVLAPGGRFVVADTVSPGRSLLDTWLQSIELLRDPSHVRNPAPAEWLATLARAGLAVTGVTADRLRLDLATWLARMNTPEVRAAAIRSLWSAAPSDVRAHFAVEADGSFTLDTATIEAT